MPLRIWCRSVVNGETMETVLPGTHSVGGGPANLRQLLSDVASSRPDWSIKGPFHEDGKFARWEVVDRKGAVTATYRLVGPRDWSD